MLQPVALFCVISSIYAINYSGFLRDDDNRTRQQQVNFYAFLYILHCLFTGGGNYFKGAVLRNVVIYFLASSLIIFRNSKGDKINFYAGTLVTVCCVTTLELSVFNNYKTKLRLFLQVKQLMQSQK